MAFTGLSTNTLFTASLLAEDISKIIETIAPVEAPLLDWLGDAPTFASNIKHEYMEDFLLPNYIINSTAVNSATAVTAFQTNGLGLALSVGTILENESASPEIVQVTSIVGANSIVITRNYDGAGVGSLAVGQQLFVRGYAAIEGREHSQSNTQRLGSRKANTVGYFAIDIAASGTELAIGTASNDTFAANRAKVFRQVPSILEKEVTRGVLNGTNSLGTSSDTRTMLGIRGSITSINSTVTGSSFTADPHLYIGNVWEQAFNNGGSPSESWGIIAGRSWYRDLSNLNTTKVQDSNVSELFKRKIRTYTGPFGSAEILLSRWIPATELLLVPRERINVVPLQGRSFGYKQMASTGDNEKGMVVGEYTLELFHQGAMARLHT